jgi:AcrR family transcriptional regulator
MAEHATVIGDVALTRHGKRTRASLVRAARRVFEKRGYRDTRIADITRSANVSVGTFYTYFASKDAVFKEVLDDLALKVYSTELPSTRDLPHRERIATTNRRYLETFRDNARIWAVVEEAAMHQSDARRVLADYRAHYRSRARAAFQRWQAEGVIAPHVDTDFAADALGAMTERLAYNWFVFGDPHDPERFVDQVTAIWADGIGLRDTPGAPDGAPAPPAAVRPRKRTRRTGAG